MALAMTAISDATSQPSNRFRVFLDSRHGRHFADDVQNGLFEGKAPGGRDQRRHPTLDGLDDWPPDQQAIRHPARPAIPDGLCDSLRDRRGIAGRLISNAPSASRVACFPVNSSHRRTITSTYFRIEFDQPRDAP